MEALDSTFSVFYDRVISDYGYINRLCLELLFHIFQKASAMQCADGKGYERAGMQIFGYL
jgi:hypothetical protein